MPGFLWLTWAFCKHPNRQSQLKRGANKEERRNANKIASFGVENTTIHPSFPASFKCVRFLNELKWAIILLLGRAPEPQTRFKDQYANEGSNPPSSAILNWLSLKCWIFSVSTDFVLVPSVRPSVGYLQVDPQYINIYLHNCQSIDLSIDFLSKFALEGAEHVDDLSRFVCFIQTLTLF